MDQQDGRTHRNTIPSINVAIIRSMHKGSYDRKEETHNQDRNGESIGGEDASTLRAGT